MRKSFITGFTLAEVLITLTIIGVIAALTIPSLIQNVQDVQYKTAYKKAFSDVNQAFLRAKNDYAFIDNNNNATNVTSNIRALENYFTITKTCNIAIDEGCWVDNCMTGDQDCFWALSSQNNQGKAIGFVDNSGRQWIKYVSGSGWFVMLVDTNGNKLPNRMGRDRFPIFFVDEDGAENATAPIKIKPCIDVTVPGTNCLFGNCYYTSWLKQ